jgi:hypothetical protein
MTSSQCHTAPTQTAFTSGTGHAVSVRPSCTSVVLPACENRSVGGASAVPDHSPTPRGPRESGRERLRQVGAKAAGRTTGNGHFRARRGGDPRDTPPQGRRVSLRSPTPPTPAPFLGRPRPRCAGQDHLVAQPGPQPTRNHEGAGGLLACQFLLELCAQFGCGPRGDKDAVAAGIQAPGVWGGCGAGPDRAEPEP